MPPNARRLAVAGLLVAGLHLSPARAQVPGFPFCAWWVETTATTANIAFPDSSAAYWTTPFQATPDLRSITVRGSYPETRYFSINAYTNGGASYDCGGTASGLADFRIAPDPGSTNPFQQPAPAGGGYTVTLAPAAAGPANAIPFYDPAACTPAPANGSVPADVGFLILRAYLPQGGFGAVPLPEITLDYADGHAVTLPRCGGAPPDPASLQPGWQRRMRALLAGEAPARLSAGSQPCGRPGDAACPPSLTFFRPPESATGGLFPNVDNKYVGALVQPAPGRLVLVRGKAPSFPPGEQALPWDPASTQLRYWSLCSNIYRRPWPVVVDEVDGQEILGCAADLDTTLDAAGRYTYVVSYPGDKPSAAALAAAGATWLPFSTEQPLARHLLVLRNMLGDDFPQSVQNCAAGTDPASIAACAASMGPYYPQATTCRAALFEHGGLAACLRE